MGVRPSLPIPDVEFILGKAIWNCDVVAPEVTAVPSLSDERDECAQKFPTVVPACAVTRTIAKQQDILSDPGVDLQDKFIVSPKKLYTLSCSSALDMSVSFAQGNRKVESPLLLSQGKLTAAQSVDPSHTPLFRLVCSGGPVGDESPYFYLQDGILMRKWRPHIVPDSTASTVSQIVVPSSYRNAILSLAHDGLAGHLVLLKAMIEFCAIYFGLAYSGMWFITAKLVTSVNSLGNRTR